MECVKFNLSGNTGFFKKPDVNEEIYFTYNNIHKIALLGILGAILGLKGWNQSSGNLPEFYNKLRDLNVGIEPLNMGIFRKKIIEFNNATGMASDCGTLIVKQQWLFSPNWNIYILEEHPYYQKIKENLLNSEAEFLPYLGSNDHPANISQIEIINIQKTNEEKINSLFIDENNETYYDHNDDNFDPFTVSEYNPIELEKDIGYIKKKFKFTNENVKELKNTYKCLDKNIFFF